LIDDQFKLQNTPQEVQKLFASVYIRCRNVFSNSACGGALQLVWTPHR